MPSSSKEEEKGNEEKERKPINEQRIFFHKCNFMVPFHRWLAPALNLTIFFFFVLFNICLVGSRNLQHNSYQFIAFI